MANRQERNNRSQGQRLRRNKEVQTGLIEGQERLTELVAQHDRDLRMMKARIASLEHDQARK